MKLSIIIPVLNEEKSINGFLKNLQTLRTGGHELIVVDGGSQDQTEHCCNGLCDVFLGAEKGRALQMNEGASQASGEVLLFLHADTVLPNNVDLLIEKTLRKPECIWGRFDIKLTGSSILFSLIALLMNIRSRLSGIATGDQAIFVKTEAFRRLGGYERIPLMEDIAISKQLKRIASPVCLKEKVVTSSRRWEENGTLKTIVLMWRLRLAYFLGADPKVLVEKYYR